MRFEGGSSLRLYRQTVEDFSLYSGKEMSQSEYEKLKEAAGKMSAKMRAVRILSASSVSKGDLEHRLIEKGENPVQAREAVQWLSDMDLLDDEKTARQIVERCISKGYGPARAKQALYEKRIPKAYWEAALSGYPDQQDYIIEFLQSKAESFIDPKALRRAVDALLRRGHSYGEIRRALDGLSLQTEELDG